MNASVAIQKTTTTKINKKTKVNCTGSYLKGLKNQNREHFLNLRESNSLKTPVHVPEL